MRALAVRHVEIEHLGAMERVLKNTGFQFGYLDTAMGQTLTRPLEDYQLIVMLGGYMGAYEENTYPFLSYEFKLMEEALKRNIPLIGICLGSQMLAKVLGAKVYKGEKGKEIGWLEVFKSGEHVYFESFHERLTVFQWHGGTFDLPQGSVRVYSSNEYENQAFVYGKAVGLQFHIEVDRSMVETWAKDYEEELIQENTSTEELLSQNGSEQEALIQHPVKKLLNS